MCVRVWRSCARASQSVTVRGATSVKQAAHACLCSQPCRKSSRPAAAPRGLSHTAWRQPQFASHFRSCVQRSRPTSAIPIASTLTLPHSGRCTSASIRYPRPSFFMSSARQLALFRSWSRMDSTSSNALGWVSPRASPLRCAVLTSPPILRLDCMRLWSSAYCSLRALALTAG